MAARQDPKRIRFTNRNADDYKLVSQTKAAFNVFRALENQLFGRLQAVRKLPQQGDQSPEAETYADVITAFGVHSEDAASFVAETESMHGNGMPASTQWADWV